MVKEIEYPFTVDKVRELKVGEIVHLSGCVFTGRDRLHKYLFGGGKCPVDLKSAAIYHSGPIVLLKEGKWIARSIGPTTSMRQEVYMPKIIEQHRVGLIIGKGGMGEGTRKACTKYGCVYLQAIGGAASLMASKIEEITGVHFMKEFGPTEALWELRVRNFEVLVTMDAHGRNLHKRVETVSKRALKKVLQKNPV